MLENDLAVLLGEADMSQIWEQSKMKNISLGILLEPRPLGG
jgi:hypothetical protein